MMKYAIGFLTMPASVWLAAYAAEMLPRWCFWPCVISGMMLFAVGFDLTQQALEEMEDDD